MNGEAAGMPVEALFPPKAERASLAALLAAELDAVCDTMRMGRVAPKYGENDFHILAAVGEMWKSVAAYNRLAFVFLVFICKEEFWPTTI